MFKIDKCLSTNLVVIVFIIMDNAKKFEWCVSSLFILFISLLFFERSLVKFMKVIIKKLNKWMNI